MPDEIAAQFLARLWELQAAAGLSNGAVARRIGVTAAYIGRLRDGQRGRYLTLEFALRAASAFPELQSFLSVDMPVSHTDTPTGTEETGP